MKANLKSDDPDPSDFMYRPRTITEIAELYGYTVRIMKRKIKVFAELIGKRVGWYYDPIQIETIFKQLGIPPGLSKKRVDHIEEYSGHADWPKNKKQTD